MKTKKLLSLFLLLFGGIMSTAAQTAAAVTVGSQVTDVNNIVSGKAYILQSQAGGTGTLPYINDNGTNYDIPMSNACNESSVYYLISNGDGTWKIKNYYTNHYWGVPVYNAALTSVENEASAGAWSLNFSNGIAYPSAPDAENTVRGLDRSSNKLLGFTTGTSGTKQVKIYEVGPTEKGLSKPIDIVSGWYLIKWIDTNSDTNTNYSDADVNGKYIKNYAQDVTVNSTNYSLYLDNAPTGTDGIALSLIYFEKKGSESGRGVDGYLRSANGHYVTQTGAASNSKGNNNYIIYRSSSTPYYSVIASGYTDATRYSLIPCGKDATPYIGQSAQNKFPVGQFYSVDFSLYGLQPWSVEFDGEEGAQVTYSGSSIYGLKSVYNGGTFFFANGVTPVASDFSAPTRWGLSPDIEVDATNHTVKVTYIDIHKVYTINNTYSNRGALIYNPENPKYVWSSGKSGTFDATNANSQWVIIPTGTSGQFYLYNVGAGKFAIPTGIAQSASNSWIFSDNAVAVIFETQGDGTKKIKMATNPVSGTNDAYVSVSNSHATPIFNYNDDGSVFTITKVTGDASTAANAAVAKLIKNQTALTTYPQTTGWYAIQIKSKDNTPSYAGRYLQNATSLHNDLYPLTFTGAIDVQPAITDPTFFTYIDHTSWDVNTWQLPDGRFLVNNGSNKFPTPSATAGNVICGYDNGNYFKENNNYYADPYNSDANYFVGETTYKRTSYTVYPIDLTAAGLTAWKVTVEGLNASKKVTCSRSDISGLSSVYNNGFFFLPTGVTPVEGDFTVSIEGTIVSLNVNIDTDAKTLSASLPVLTINSPMAEATFTWNGVSKTGKTVEFPYMGGTINDPTITVSYSGNEYSSPTLSQSTWDGTVSTTVTCSMTPAFFSASYGEKWIRIGNALGGGTVMGLSTCVSGETVKMKTLDYFDEAQLWCFVGSLESFNIYNKKAGQSLQMASSSTTITNDVTAVMLAAGSAATEWKLMNKLDASNGPGWAIYYSNHDGSRALNAKGGTAVGNTVGYYNNGDGNGGSRWLFSDANGQVTLAMSGLNAESMTEYTKDIAAMPITIDGTTSENLITKDNFGTLTFYVPLGSELTFGTPKMFLNYAFSSLSDNSVTASTTPQTVSISFATARSDARYLWGPLRQNNSDYYRIPAIVTAKNGDVIAINDRRFGHAGDLGIGGEHHIDLIGVASSDNGATWSEEFMVMDGTGSGASAGYGDAAVVADRESNQVLVMACGGNVSYPGSTSSNHQSIARVVLSKTGERWTASSITNVAGYFYAGELASSAGMFIGSGSITQSSIIKKGTHYRVYCAVLARDYKNYALYSDDFGQTWTLMGSVAANNDEAKVAELPDGSVLLSVRKSYGRTFNVWTWDDESYTSGSWGTAVNTNNQTGGIRFDNNSTNGDIRTIPAIKKATGEMVTLAMQSVPTGNGRSKVSLFYKELDPTVTYTPITIAQNWSSAYQVTPYNSAYSSFNVQADGRIALFLEEAPRTMIEGNVGYYMCYVPLTIDEITGNQYTGIPSTYPLPLNVVGDKSYATLYLPFDVMTTGATKAYYVETANNGSAQMTETGNGGTEIPAFTAVVLINGDADVSTVLNMTSGLTPVISESANLLKGTLTSISLDLSDGTDYYSMGRKDGKIGFYKFEDNNGTTTIDLGANKAYLSTTTAPNSVKGFTFDFDDANSIASPLGEAEEGASIFNLAGQRVSKPMQRGLYIKGGKKVVIQ